MEEELCVGAMENDSRMNPEQNSSVQRHMNVVSMNNDASVPFEYANQMPDESHWYNSQPVQNQHDFKNMIIEMEALRQDNKRLFKENTYFRRTFENSLPSNVDLSNVVFSWRFREPHLYGAHPTTVFSNGIPRASARGRPRRNAQMVSRQLPGLPSAPSCPLPCCYNGPPMAINWARGPSFHPAVGITNRYSFDLQPISHAGSSIAPRAEMIHHQSRGPPIFERRSHDRDQFDDGLAKAAESNVVGHRRQAVEGSNEEMRFQVPSSHSALPMIHCDAQKPSAPFNDNSPPQPVLTVPQQQYERRPVSAALGLSSRPRLCPTPGLPHAGPHGPHQFRLIEKSLAEGTVTGNELNPGSSLACLDERQLVKSYPQPRQLENERQLVKSQPQTHQREDGKQLVKSQPQTHQLEDEKQLVKSYPQLHQREDGRQLVKSQPQTHKLEDERLLKKSYPQTHQREDESRQLVKSQPQTHQLENERQLIKLAVINRGAPLGRSRGVPLGRRIAKSQSPSDAPKFVSILQNDCSSRPLSGSVRSQQKLSARKTSKTSGDILAQATECLYSSSNENMMTEIVAADRRLSSNHLVQVFHADVLPRSHQMQDEAKVDYRSSDKKTSSNDTDTDVVGQLVVSTQNMASVDEIGLNNGGVLCNKTGQVRSELVGMVNGVRNLDNKEDQVLVEGEKSMHGEHSIESPQVGEAKDSNNSMHLTQQVFSFKGVAGHQDRAKPGVTVGKEMVHNKDENENYCCDEDHQNASSERGSLNHVVLGEDTGCKARGGDEVDSNGKIDEDGELETNGVDKELGSHSECEISSLASCDTILYVDEPEFLLSNDDRQKAKNSVGQSNHKDIHEQNEPSSPAGKANGSCNSRGVPDDIRMMRGLKPSSPAGNANVENGSCNSRGVPDDIRMMRGLKPSSPAGNANVENGSCTSRGLPDDIRMMRGLKPSSPAGKANGENENCTSRGVRVLPDDIRMMRGLKEEMEDKQRSPPNSKRKAPDGDATSPKRLRSSPRVASSENSNCVEEQRKSCGVKCGDPKYSKCVVGLCLKDCMKR